MKLSQENTFAVQGYNIYERNSNVLTNIFQKHPRIDNKFFYLGVQILRTHYLP
ncbi:hypothetical protein Gogos_019721 [Gossypium gossypioides]|uniref:Uncharacterized protein n=1 Tax=Gossypium gossypioides TaxID=34282 RepID=A0A7J9BIC8_GOSGO|nr:hypothetical protein [Gossypium gossypioides]